MSENDKPRRKSEREKESQARRRAYRKAEQEAAPRKPKLKDRFAGEAKSELIRKDDRAPKTLEQWREMMWNSIMMNPTFSEAEQDELSNQIARIAVEAQKGGRADLKRVEKALNVLGVMEPDVFEVAVGTLPALLEPIGVTLSSANGQARLESRHAGKRSG